MHSTRILATLFSASLAYAEAVVQVAAEGNVHTVTVGGATPQIGATPLPKLQYEPESIEAAVGDTVRFVFMQLNHTATQSAFDQPCVKLEGGMDSGFQPNPDGLPGVTWDMPVTTTEPIWMYCAQKEGAHCGHGMVFSVNAATTGDSTFSAFKQLAIAQNGTGAAAGADALQPAGGLVGGGGGEQVEQQTVTMNAQGAVATGVGVAADGSQCQCQCLCDFAAGVPQEAGIGAIGGAVGTLPGSH